MKQSATCDTSFWINAHRSGLLALVLRRYRLYFAPAVAMEMNAAFPSGREFWRQARAGLIAEKMPRSRVVTQFGPGERSAMNLAIDNPGWVLKMDDRRPLLEAQRLGLQVVCTPVLALHLYRDRELDLQGALGVLARLAAMQTVSPELLSVALAELPLARGQKGEH